MDLTSAFRIPLDSGQILLTWLIVLCLSGGGRTQTTCDQCDCTISDPENGERAIINVKPKCREGQITWLSSYGAIRLELDSLLPGDFRFCFRVESDNCESSISEEIVSRTPGNYKLKLLKNEEVRLSPLFNIRGRSMEYCISGSGPVRLYLETQRSFKDTGVPRVTVHYDVEKTNAILSYNPMEECRPCSDAELLRAYCTSDFVAVGSMDDVTHDDLEEKTNIRVSVTQLIMQASKVFKQTSDWAPPHELKGVVRAPRRCGIRHGAGEFLFTGRVRLGEPVLACAPRYEQWKRILEDAVINEKLECSFHT